MNGKKRMFDTKNLYLAAWLLSKDVIFSHTDLDTEDRTRFHFEDKDKCSQLVKEFYNHKEISGFLSSLQKAKQLANSTKDQSNSLPR